MGTKKNNKNIIAWLRFGAKYRFYAIVLSIIMGAIFFIGFLWKQNDYAIKAETTINQKIDITPSEIRSIQDIGQWEFLHVSTEELVDTIREHFLSNDRLTRIYYGSIRLGIDLKKFDPKQTKVANDTLFATLPPIEILNPNIIDEARTRAFIEEGNWNAADREMLYEQAKHKILQRCLTKNNLQVAEENAKTQLGNVFKAMGFKVVVIKIEKNKLTNK